MSKQRRASLSNISMLHFLKLGFRSALFLAAAGAYIHNRVHSVEDRFSGLEDYPYLLIFIWAVFAVEMVLRFFPSRNESIGRQKQFRERFVPTDSVITYDPAMQRRPNSTIIVAVSWLALNGVIGFLYLTGRIDRGILLLICLAYSVCDMICLLFFCPFQMWIMKNKCCGSCRIYNWDYAMMFTPLIFISGVFTWSLLALSLGILIKWEIAVKRHPERFSETTNASLSCKSCNEKLCSHKRSLQRFLKRQRKLIQQETAAGKKVKGSSV